MYTHFQGQPLPIIPSFLRETLQLTLDTFFGDWYLFKDYIFLKIYGFEEQHYQWPTFLTHHIFGLEYV